VNPASSASNGDIFFWHGVKACADDENRIPNREKMERI
jgi:hypothetical protein